MKKNPYIFIMNFLAEVPEPNPFLFNLILANQFKGEVLYCEGDFITKIKDKYYDVEGEVLSDELELHMWSRLDLLSIFETVESYEACKWFFTNPYIIQDLYDCHPN